MPTIRKRLASKVRVACYLVQMIEKDKSLIYKFKNNQDQLSDTKHFILEWVKKMDIGS